MNHSKGSSDFYDHSKDSNDSYEQTSLERQTVECDCVVVICSVLNVLTYFPWKIIYGEAVWEDVSHAKP